MSEILGFARNELYDFVVIDPPWRNKFIRRVRVVKREEGSVSSIEILLSIIYCSTNRLLFRYDMMSNEDILKIPVEDLVNPNAIVAIWCTNSPTHSEFIRNVALPKWNLKLLTTFYWVKVNNCCHCRSIVHFNLLLDR